MMHRNTSLARMFLWLASLEMARISKAHERDVGRAKTIAKAQESATNAVIAQMHAEDCYKLGRFVGQMFSKTPGEEGG